MTSKDLEKLEGLHGALTDVLLDLVKSGNAKASDLNVARQFLRDNGIDAVPTEDNPLGKLLEELPFDEKRKNPVKNN